MRERDCAEERKRVSGSRVYISRMQQGMRIFHVSTVYKVGETTSCLREHSQRQLCKINAPDTDNRKERSEARGKTTKKEGKEKEGGK